MVNAHPANMAVNYEAQPMLLVLFMRGSFTLTDVHAASYSLWAFNAGLLSFMLIKILANGYYARQDTKTPVKIGIIAMVSNMGFNVLAIPFSYVGVSDCFCHVSNLKCLFALSWFS